MKDIDSTIRLERFVKRWNFLSRRHAAQALGISERMLYWYLHGKYKVPRTVELLMTALEQNWNNPRVTPSVVLPKKNRVSRTNKELSVNVP